MARETRDARISTGRVGRNSRTSRSSGHDETQLDWVTALEAAYREGYEAGTEDESIGTYAPDERWAQSETKAGY